MINYITIDEAICRTYHNSIKILKILENNPISPELIEEIVAILESLNDKNVELLQNIEKNSLKLDDILLFIEHLKPVLNTNTQTLAQVSIDTQKIREKLGIAEIKEDLNVIEVKTKKGLFGKEKLVIEDVKQ